MTTPDPNNHRNPLAEVGRFTGLYPDNTYPLVDGKLDVEQEKRKEARQESDRTPRGVLATNGADVYDTPNETYPAHPAFTEKGPAGLTATDFQSDSYPPL